MEKGRNINEIIGDGEQARRFRDVADEDYIMARIAYRHKLIYSFLYSSHQSIEKYLKSILLYNGFDLNNFDRKERHNISKIYEVIKTNYNFITDDTPQICEKFINYLNLHGFNRYGDKVASLGTFDRKFNEIYVLDRTIWTLRRFAVNIVNKKGTIDRPYLVFIKSDKLLSKPNLFSITNGTLEKILSSKTKTRDELNYKNGFFGKRLYKNNPSPTFGKIVSGRSNMPYASDKSVKKKLIR